MEKKRNRKSIVCTTNSYYQCFFSYYSMYNQHSISFSGRPRNSVTISMKKFHPHDNFAVSHLKFDFSCSYFFRELVHVYFRANRICKTTQVMEVFIVWHTHCAKFPIHNLLIWRGGPVTKTRVT